MSDSNLDSDVPELRVRAGNAAACNPEGDYVLYWMIAFRRTLWNFSLQRAVDWARDLKKPLVIFDGGEIAIDKASPKARRNTN